MDSESDDDDDDDAEDSDGESDGMVKCLCDFIHNMCGMRITDTGNIFSQHLQRRRYHVLLM